MIGDGRCNAEENNASCGYDGGDCCLCSCSSAACFLGDFDCVDPDADNEVFECRPAPPAALLCSAEAQQVWVVETSAQARALAAAVNCSGGSFEVEWRGSVVMDEPIYVTNGTALAVTGVGSDAVMDGGGLIRIFTIVDASLSLSRVSISSGSSVAGGAIAASRSTLVLNQTDFVGNSATGNGGALFVSESSEVHCVGSGIFADNRAAMGGGAMYVTGSSVVSCAGSWVRNAAGSFGGAVSLRGHSNVSWGDSEAYFALNSAGTSGGALFITNGSSVSWHARTVFDSNSAASAGGAGTVTDSSSMFWDAPTVLGSNQAGNAGGALAILESSSVFWGADTSFLGNAAGSSGGAVVVRASNMSWGGETNTTLKDNRSVFSGGAVLLTVGSHSSCDEKTTTMFANNSAGDDGGAVSVEDQSSVYFSGKTSFTANRARGDHLLDPGTSGLGGALAIFNSTATWGGTASLTGNTAVDGGAVSLVDASSSWTGVTTVLGNSAGLLGGALAASRSNVSWGGSSDFLDNSAEAGGAMSLTFSSMDWVGQTQFGGNSADVAGGALSTYASSVSWSGVTDFYSNNAGGDVAGGGAIFASNGSLLVWGGGKATFANNSATAFGGALSVTDDSNVSWSSETDFNGNTAFTGGALFLDDGSHIGWTGDTVFSSNEATADGGAVGSFSSDAGGSRQQSSLAIKGPVTFINNSCGANGGVFAMLGALSVDIGAAGATFSRNHAGVAGGAVFVSGTGIGPTFTGVSFLSNSAQVGGAVSTVGSGNLKESAGVVPQNPTTFDRCRFIDNAATATGGAIESASGQDAFVGSVFRRNTAGTGGALRLAGTSSLDNCSFVDNVSGDGEGAAVSNIGFVLRMENMQFADNVFACQPGMFLRFNEVSYKGAFECVFPAALSLRRTPRYKSPFGHDIDYTLLPSD